MCARKFERSAKAASANTIVRERSENLTWRLKKKKKTKTKSETTKARNRKKKKKRREEKRREKKQRTVKRKFKEYSDEMEMLSGLLVHEQWTWSAFNAFACMHCVCVR